MLIKFDDVKLNNIIINNKLKKFLIREINLIKNFIYLANKVSNIVNIKKL